MRRFALGMTACVVAVLFAAGGASAQSCFSMQAELMHLQRNQGGYDERSRYDRAYREQAETLARTEQHARSAGCFGGGFFLFRREQSGICRTLVPRLRDMQQNLARLDQLRRRAGNDQEYRIRELRSMMRDRGCDLPGRSIFEASPERRLLWEDDSFYSSRGTYRTLCVRTCDGYYFPISFSTRQEQFTVDAQTCQAMCPGAQAELYYHPNPGGGPETMRSIAGVPYAALPTAFQYRDSYDPACSCRPAGGYAMSTAAAPSNSPQTVALADPTAPLPRPRPAPGEDPETLANRAGDFVPRAGDAEEKTAQTATVVTGADGRTVRVVGPAFWGAPQHDDLVIAPIPN